MDCQTNRCRKTLHSGVLLFLCICATIILSLTACNDGTAADKPTPPPRQKPVDVCKLVTATEMGQAVGGQFSATLKDGTTAGEMYCTYKNTSNPKSPAQNISLLTQDAKNSWDSMLAGHANDPKHYTQMEIDGNKALFEQRLSRLWVYKNGYTLIIAIYVPNADGTGNDSARALEITKQLAQIALKRL